ncbi:MAG: hypothetical protein J7M17_05415, partial [Anaerolineae bacterium]|nr:hypothetical protein [Anaerolineae bacterium]
VVGIPSQSQDRHWAQRRGEEHVYFDRWFDRLTTGLSTRLKILTRITEPTEGHAELHGRLPWGIISPGRCWGSRWGSCW